VKNIENKRVLGHRRVILGEEKLEGRGAIWGGG